MTKSGLNPADFTGKVDGKDVQLYILTNNKGAEVTVLNYGAKIVSLMVPDKNGKLTDVVQGHQNLDAYLHSEEPSFGAVCGRVANRIAKGKFTLEGKEYQLAINNGPNSLHGGVKGFHFVVWDAKQIDGQTVELTYLAKDGEENYPGNLTTKVTYHLTEDNALDVKYEATTDKTTILNVTNHSYFNLSGDADQDAMDHVVVIDAKEYLPTDETSIPLGKPATVVGTPFDFLSPHTLAERINEDFEQLRIGKGYDHCWVLNKKEGEYAFAVECTSPKTGICMTIHTSEPGVQVYTANWLAGKQVNKNGHKYPERSSVCFETQHYPDAINHPDYPTVILKPGDKFESRTTFAFSVK
ncbi:aldose epimerase family protein [Dysgonomonas sp. 25]|uniref:aldose epimerase family protein n=1 Tax=Dysgonomonas sp. 25 TaxID=2302933 RepID=UPI0013D332E0|nr:aldose epimerase family protein [Dysgonomonas sp. 25]NDV69862.1 galactose mutarotase [Dysgonomonas sp. 25]